MTLNTPLTYEQALQKAKEVVERESPYEDYEAPNDTSIQMAALLIFNLHNITIDLSTTVEGGMYVGIVNEYKIMHVELYNDGDLGYIVEDIRGDLWENEDVETVKEMIDIIKKFCILEA